MASAATGSADHQALFDEVLGTVTKVLIDVIGEEFYEECEITLDSTFAEDMELESTEVVQLVERLLETFDERVDFVQWFADFDLDDILKLTLGDLVTFVVTSLEETPTAG
jgi:acyl carrier protein